MKSLLNYTISNQRVINGRKGNGVLIAAESASTYLIVENGSNITYFKSSQISFEIPTEESKNLKNSSNS